jgi:DNA polymerase III delta prime subunit
MNISGFWIEQYRPKTLDDLCVSDDVKAQILEFGKNMPNLLFTGVSGTGKTTIAQIIVKDILNCDYLYINASDENGVDTIRSKVMGFAQTKSFDGELKVVVLDESDGLSKESQKILRNVMETYAGTTRFILTGNYKHKIIPALQSRCQSIDLKPDLKDALKRCLYILEQEKIKVSQEQKKLLVGLVKSHFPDLRKCIGAMQQSCRDGVLSIKVKSNTNELCELIYSNIQKKKGLATRKYWIENDQIFNSDYEQILSDLLNFYYDQPMDEIKKKQSILTIAEYLFKASQVMDKEINAFACILQLETI